MWPCLILESTAFYFFVVWLPLGTYYRVDIAHAEREFDSLREATWFLVSSLTTQQCLFINRRLLIKNPLNILKHATAKLYMLQNTLPRLLYSVRGIFGWKTPLLKQFSSLQVITWLPCTGHRYWSISVVPNFSGYFFPSTHCACGAHFHSADRFCVLCWYVLSILSVLYFIPNIYMQPCKLYNFLSPFYWQRLLLILCPFLISLSMFLVYFYAAVYKVCLC